MYRYVAQCRERILKAGILPALGGNGVIEQNATELAWFCAWCKVQGVKTWLEIGTSRGGLMAFVERELGVTATGVNLFRPDQPVRGNVIIGDSHDEAVRKEVEKLGPYDVVFIDGDHSYEGVAQDAEWYAPLATKIVAYHDILGLRECEPVRKHWIELVTRIEKVQSDAWIEFAEPGDQGVGIGAVLVNGGVSVVLPHLPSEINDEALALARPAWGKQDPGLIQDIQILRDKLDPYVLWNEHVSYANTDTVLFTNSDVVLSSDWMRIALPYAKEGRVVFGVLIEPGAMGVAPENVARDFGMCPRCFRAEAFQGWVDAHRTSREDVVHQQGWPMPCLMNKRDFIACGKFPTGSPFMHAPNDLFLLEKMRNAGIEMVTVPAYAYHFQNLSRRGNTCGCYFQESTRPA